MQSSCKGPGRHVLYFLFIILYLRLMVLARFVRTGRRIFLNIGISYSLWFVRKGRRILLNIWISNSLRFQRSLHLILVNRDKT